MADTPLGHGSKHPIRAVLFDFDGTLTRPEAIDFSALRARVGVPSGTPILEFIESLPAVEERARRHRILEDFEAAAARASLPNTGAEEILLLLHERGFRLGILTRNTRNSIDLALGNFRRVGHSLFDAIITREHEGRPKPHPDGVYAAAHLLGVTPEEMLVVGDFIFDIDAGRAAGSPTVLITNAPGRDVVDKAAADAKARIGGEAPHLDAAPDHVIASLEELKQILGL
jgi:HAD superfamily hydrolase (TIGR01509 family)